MAIDWRCPEGVTRLILVRHGEPDESARGRCYGRLDVALSPVGVDQARRGAAWLATAPITAIYSSPRQRALFSAEPLARARRLTVRIREELAEIDFGQFEGLTYDEAAARHPAIYAAWMERPTEVTFPDGESFALLRRRVLAAAGELRRAHVGATLAIYAHGGVHRALLADALGVPDERVFRIDQSYGAVSVIDHLADGTAIVRLLNAAPPGA